jgi:hypothetical protein
MISMPILRRTEVPSKEEIDKVTIKAILAETPAARTRVLRDVGKLIKEDIEGNFGYILDLAPVYQLMPISPIAGKEEETLSILKKAVSWARKQKGVLSADVYQLVKDNDPSANKKPMFVVTLLVGGGGGGGCLLSHLKDNQKAMEFQKLLGEITDERSLKDENIMSINTALIGISS